MRLTGRIVFAIRAAAELVGREEYVPLDIIAEAQDLPADYVRSAMSDLRRAGIVSTRRGRVGGYRLARPADAVTLADIIRAVDGPLTVVQGERPDNLEYAGAAAGLEDVWLAVRKAERRILESVTLAHLSSGELPPEVREV
ncbi:MAG: Rrf2 family transcriptional regulator [Candidatus Nanopelagicales bacterium]|jgi:Rrf2 family protein|nr:Rrf2 family transcriptional regulator [Candidatus Nanopelagicales bacterium]MCU0298183.1 Rrf2 family transcriptional regulator [Candidatus Nanopelagicales bacterium]